MQHNVDQMLCQWLDAALLCSHWLQRGDCNVQEHQVPSLGSGWPDKHQAILAMLLPKYTGVRCHRPLMAFDREYLDGETEALLLGRVAGLQPHAIVCIASPCCSVKPALLTLAVQHIWICMHSINWHYCAATCLHVMCAHEAIPLICLW